jgi:hypothetical protein
MPALIDKIIINNELLDKRVKLLKSDKQEIVKLYKTGEYSQRHLAKLYNVSRRSIVFALYPERREANYKVRVSNGGSKQYYDKDNHTKYMQTHRTYKTKLLNQGDI